MVCTDFLGDGLIVILSKDNPGTRREFRRVLSLRPAWPTYQGVDGGGEKGEEREEKQRKRWQRDLMSARWRPWYTKPPVWVVSLLTDTTFTTDLQRRAHFACIFRLLFSALWLTGGWDVDLVLIFGSQCLKIIYIYILMFKYIYLFIYLS